MVEEARLESVYTPKGYHEFESRSLRNIQGKKGIRRYLRCIPFFVFSAAKKRKFSFRGGWMIWGQRIFPVGRHGVSSVLRIFVV